MEEDQKNNGKKAPSATVKFMPSKSSTDKEISSSEDVIRTTNPDRRQNVHSNDDGSVQKGSFEDYNISIRLRLLEQQVQNNFNLSDQSLSSSAMSVVVSLRWSLLREIEKSLKLLPLGGLAQYGLGSYDISVTTQCDYNNFCEITALLGKEHKASIGNRSGARVSFSPSLPIIQ